MYWADSGKPERYVVPDDVMDVVYQIDCRTLPVDHAWVLSQAILAVLPWLADEPGAGVHPLHVAESGNGWMRPEGPDALLHLSRRTKLTLRVPKHRLEQSAALSGTTLDIAGHRLTVQASSTRLLVPFSAVFARHVPVAAGQEEAAFIEQLVPAIQALGVTPRKLLCGREHVLATPRGPLATRSVMLADLPEPESVALQRHGLGPYRTLGCGLFIPHKDIKEVRAVLD